MKSKQDRQCTCNVKLRRLHETTVAVETQRYYIFLCMCVSVFVSVDSRACACARVALFIQHATSRYIVICDLWLHHIFRHCLINGTIFGKILLHVRCVF